MFKKTAASRAEPAYLRVPDVHTFVKGAAGQVPSVGAEGHAVNGLLVARECVDASTALCVPQPYRRVKGCTTEEKGWVQGGKQVYMKNST